MEILSYVIVVLFSRISLAISSFFSVPLSLIFAWLPKRKLATVASFVSGVLGPLLSVLFSKYIFAEIGEFTSYTLEMYLAAILPMFIPIFNDYKKYRELQNKENELISDVNSDTPSKADTMGAFPLGAIVGMLLSLILFL